jgi:hypothetical protein
MKIYACAFVFSILTLAGCSKLTSPTSLSEASVAAATPDAAAGSDVNSTTNTSSIGSTDVTTQTTGPVDPRINSTYAYGLNIWLPFAGGQTPDRLAYLFGSGKTLIFNEDGNQTYSGSLPAGAAFSGGFNDFNGDGYPDYAVITSAASGTVCNDGVAAQNSMVSIYSGNSPTNLLYQSGNFTDRCIPLNGGATIRYPAMFMGALQYGPYSNLFTISPQYLATSWEIWNGGGAYLYTAESSGYAPYVNARPMLQPSAGGLSYAALNQSQNGLIINYNGSAQYVATQSGRFQRYATAPYSTSQLLQDVPFLARTDIVGRNYGLLQHDTDGNVNNVFLIAGVQASDLLNDMQTGYGSGVVNGSNVWGAIERHVSVYNMATGTVAQHFYSYAHDPNNTNAATYINRVSYPSYGRLPSQNSAGSHMVYNVFDGVTWNVHISSPGGVADQSIVPNMYVWDLIPVDANTVDVLISPIDQSRNIWVPNYVNDSGVPQSWKQAHYFPQMLTYVYRWTRSAETWGSVGSLAGGVPYLAYTNNRATEAATSGIFTSLRGLDSATRTHTVVEMYKPDTGTYFEALLPALP